MRRAFGMWCGRVHRICLGDRHGPLGRCSTQSIYFDLVGSVALNVRGGSGDDDFCLPPFFPRNPSTDAPFPVTLLVHTQRATDGELRDARLSCRAGGELEAFRALGMGDFLCGASSRPRLLEKDFWSMDRWRAVAGPATPRVSLQSFIGAAPPGAGEVIFSFFPGPADIRVILMFHRPHAERSGTVTSKHQRHDNNKSPLSLTTVFKPRHRAHHLSIVPRKGSK